MMTKNQHAAKRGNTLPFNSQSAMSARAINGRETEYRIDGVRGLVLRVRPRGQATWYFYYRTKVGVGVSTRWMLRKLKLDNREHLTLSQARKAADELRSKVNKGADPKAEREAKRIADERAKREASNKGVTFRHVFELRLSKDATIKPSTKEFYRATLQARPNGAKSVLDQIGDIAADEITPQQIVAVLDRIEARGAIVAADRTKAVISAVYKWALSRQSVKNNPTVGLGRRSNAEPRDKEVTENELRAWWKATEAPEAELSPAMRLIIQLATLTGQRRTEVAGARLEELQLDGPSPVWTISGDTRTRGKTAMTKRGRTKNSKTQVVPLSRQAAKLWRKALSLSDGNEYLFPADMAHVKIGKEPRTPHIHGQSVTTAVRRLRRDFNLSDITIHDTRRMIGRWCGDNGIRPDVIERILNHSPQDVTRRHYNQSPLEPMVRQALQAWANHVEAVVNGKQRALGGKVVRLVSA